MGSQKVGHDWATFTSLHFNHLKYAIQWHLIHSQWQLSLSSFCTIFITLKENLVLIKQPLHVLPFLHTVEATNLLSAHVCVLSRFSHVWLFAMDCSPSGSSIHGNLQARILERGWHALLEGIFLTQGSNWCLFSLLHWQMGSLPLSLLGSPICFLALWIFSRNQFYIFHINGIIYMRLLYLVFLLKSVILLSWTLVAVYVSTSFPFYG